MKVKRWVSRTIQVRQFEPLVVGIEVEDEVEPKNLLKRAKELEELCYQEVMTRIHIERPSLIPNIGGKVDRVKAGDQAREDVPTIRQ